MHFTKSATFVLLSAAFACGVLIESVVHIEKLWLGIAMAFFVAWFAWEYQYMKTRDYKVLLLSAALFVVCLGVLRMHAAIQPNQFEPLFDTTQQLEGMIVSDIDIRADKQLFQFRPDRYRQKILVTALLAESFAYGDRLVLTDKIEQAKNFEDFDYQKFLEKDNIYALMRYPKVKLLKAEQGNPLITLLLKTKQLFIGQIERVLPEPQRSLLLGILIGAKKTLPDDVVQNFNNTGTSHIVAVSGYNIAVIIFALASLAKFIGRKSSFWISVALIAVYVVMAGASASVLRAAIMGGLLLVSLTIGRLYRIIPALCFAALLMLLVNPKILFYDVGFQLSFLATLGIILFVPLLESLTQKISNPFQLKTMLLATCSAIIATGPLILLQFERFSLVAPLVNILILPVIPATMLFGFLSIIPFIGYGFGFISQGLLWYELAITRLFAHVPYASLEFHIDAWIFALLYADIILVFIFLRLLLKQKKLPSGSS